MIFLAGPAYSADLGQLPEAGEVAIANSSSYEENVENSEGALPDSAQVDPMNPPVDGGGNVQDENSAAEVQAGAKEILLFNGKGISTSDWKNTEKIVKSMGLTYQLVNSAELNNMSLDQMAGFGLIIVPGGHRGAIMRGLNPETELRVRQAVRDLGVSYIGFCAGSFAAVGELANTDETSNKDMAIILGEHLSTWRPEGAHHIADMVKVDFADGSSRWLVWWGGPWTPEWQGGVVARYANGKPAISQGWSNKGFVILAGPHPEAPKGWRNKAGHDPDGLDYELTKSVINAALTQTPLPAFQ